MHWTEVWACGNYRFKRSINRGLQHYVDAGGLSVHVMSAQI